MSFTVFFLLYYMSFMISVMTPFAFLVCWTDWIHRCYCYSIFFFYRRTRPDWTDRKKYRQTDRQTDRQADREKVRKGIFGLCEVERGENGSVKRDRIVLVKKKKCSDETRDKMWREKGKTKWKEKSRKQDNEQLWMRMRRTENAKCRWINDIKVGDGYEKKIETETE